jgi:uncharacterized protein with FMN-binding domain
VTPIKHNLVALGSAAVLAVYTAGYARTRSAAQRFATESADRRPPPESPGPVAQHAAAPAPPAVSRRPDTNATPASPAIQHASAPTRAQRAPAHRTDSTSTPTAAPAETIAPAVVAPPATPIPDSSTKTPPVQTTDSAAKATDKGQAPYKDGTYSGWGTSRHGDIEASVLIKDGRIAAAIISQCLTRYSCSWISELPGQVVARQSPDVDFVSGATQSTNAFYYAVVEALKKAK